MVSLNFLRAEGENLMVNPDLSDNDIGSRRWSFSKGVTGWKSSDLTNGIEIGYASVYSNSNSW